MTITSFPISTTAIESAMLTTTGSVTARSLGDRFSSVINIKDYGASGSAQTTTGSISSGSAALTLASALDFRNGQGICIFGAGPVATVQLPTGLTPLTVGTAGSTTHTYQVASVDAYGGIGVATAVATINTANATLNLNTYIALSWTAPASGPVPSAYVVYRDGAFLTICAQTLHNDQGTTRAQPSWCPSTPPVAATSAMLITTISSGAGTTSLALGATAGTAVSGATVLHDDTAAFTSFITAAMGSRAGYVPAGTYNISTASNLTTTGDLEINCDRAAVLKATSNLPGTILGLEDFTGTDRYALIWRGGTFDNSGGIFGIAAASDSCIGTTRIGPILLDGVKFQGGSTQTVASMTSDSGISFVTGANVIITNCLFLGQGDLGIYCTGGALSGGSDDAGDVVISNNVFINCGGAVSVKRQMPRVIIANNVVDTCFSGFSLFEASSPAIDPGRQVTIANNIIRKVTCNAICIHAGAVDTADGSGTGITPGSRTQILGNKILDFGYLPDGVTPYSGSSAFGGTGAITGITIQGASQIRIANNIIALEDWTQGTFGSSNHKGVYITDFTLNSVLYSSSGIMINDCDFINVYWGIYEDPGATPGPTMAVNCTFQNTHAGSVFNFVNASSINEWIDNTSGFITGVMGSGAGANQWRFSVAGISAIRFRTFLDAVGFTKISKTGATLNFGSVAANSSADLTVSVTGITAASGTAYVNPQAANLVPTGISYSCHIIANATVVVRCTNATTSPITVPSGTYNVYANQIT
jgi:hypothetical protein